ncbi:uncharacterized protein B0T15DRAFT_517234 [Chaetomium strumarium]|uniref:Wax synthase domain-containing protein n=1 Tax=Chaetomium strumarium TaxID=1170767 RepID=A0AAJ0M5W8_9PEZI|nr:hypothetical protein B0T15DRAFT_517234 [Chaetomium strumarium]
MATHPPGTGLASGSDQENLSLATYYQHQYQKTFHAAVAAGEVTPFVIPWSFIGVFFLPLFYLSIPHTTRPWLYRLRWAVAAAVIYLNIRLMQTTSAGNMAVAYSTGLAAVWGTIWNLRVLIFTHPQRDAARVERRPRRSHENGFSKDEKEKPGAMVAVDESVAASLRHNHEYFWQPFPAQASFLTRLGWTADLLTSLRGGGWNFCISSIPHPPLPERLPDPARGGGNEALPPARLDLIPLASRSGTSRSRTYASFLRSRLLQFTVSYLTIDILTITMRRDPYFLLGPDYVSHQPDLPLPNFMTALPLPGITIPLARTLPAAAGILAGLHLYFALLQLVCVFLLPARIVGPRFVELWQHPTLFGSFRLSVCDRGLAGFWGGWWHQTFRLGFTAPVRFLLFPRVRLSHSRGATGGARARAAAEMLLAFFLSGVLHAAGGITSVARPTTVAWTPVAFFVSQAVGVMLQTGWCALLGTHKREFSRWARRAGNLLFAAAWLLLTARGLIDDMSRAGLWLFEPVPVSPLRMMGLGSPGESWWRWDGEYGLRWYTGRRWWESGIRL